MANPIIKKCMEVFDAKIVSIKPFRKSSARPKRVRSRMGNLQGD